MPNRLKDESSAYLRQHADNPVDWHPWGPEVFALASEQDKPILISIGYSSCHWCHVMAHESFENEYIAGLMNRHFVCVKVDREERPDVDQIYMEAVQMIARHGGWPLHAFCFPDGRPFFGGTYFPPDDRGQGMVPWPQLLMRVADYYQRKRDELESNAANIVHNLTAMNQPAATGTAPAGPADLRRAVEGICSNHDDDFGGFGSAPKFPPCQQLTFLLESRRGLEQPPPAFSPGDSAVNSSRLDQVIETTLRAMDHGGIYDQIGGGFARYSVDRHWLIPHFEKMLYDNALLIDLHAKAWRRYRDPLQQAVVEETVAWAFREMRAPHGLFYSSLDADSEGVEGKFYVWTPQQVEAVLGPEQAKRFCAAHHISADGNFEHGWSNPALVLSDFDERQSWREARQALLAAREKRVRPGRDEKQLTAWNSLFIRGLAEAAFTFDRPDWFEAAEKAADFLWREVRIDGRLRAVYDSAPRVNAFLDDYAFYAEALLALAAVADVFERGSARRWLDRAVETAEAMLEHFGDQEAAGFYFTPHDHEKLIARRKEWMDGATPAGNSSLLHVFSSLHALTGDNRWLHEFNRLARVYNGFAADVGHGTGHALTALAIHRHGVGVLTLGPEADWAGAVGFVRSRPWQRLYLLTSDEFTDPTTIQFCVGQQCHLNPDWDQIARPLNGVI